MGDSIVGKIKLKYVAFLLPQLMINVCVFNFFLCNYQGTCKPWPQSTITNCSRMYPNNIIFRYFLLMPSVLFIIIFKAMKGFLAYQNSKLKNPVTIPSIIYQFQIFGFPFFVLAVATIDGGKINFFLHELGAKVFFIVWNFSFWIQFFIFIRIYLKNPLFTNVKSLVLKFGCCMYQWYFFVDLLIRILQPINPDQKEQTDPLEVKIEWGLMVTCMTYMTSYYYDFENIDLQLDENYEFQFYEIGEKLKEQEQQKQILINKLQEKQYQRLQQ